MKKLLLYASIPSHLKTILDLAVFLKNSRNYEPIILFQSEELFLTIDDYQQKYGFKYFIYSLKAPKYIIFFRTKKNRLKNQIKKKLHYFQDQYPVLAMLGNKILKPFQTLNFLVLYVYFLLNLLIYFPKNQKSILSFKKSNLIPYVRQFLLYIFSLNWHKQSLHKNKKNYTLNKINKLVFKIIMRGVGSKRNFSTFLNKIYSKEKIQLTILPEDNLFYYSHIINYQSNIFQTKVLIIPFTIVNKFEWAEAFYQERAFNANHGINQFFKLIFPNWTLEYKNKKLILPPIYILAAEYLNVTPEVPWLINSGASDFIAVENQFMHDYYLNSGINISKLILTGTLNDDKIFRMQSNKEKYLQGLEQALNCNLKKNIVLVALPPNQFDLGVKSSVEFSEYLELIDWMLNAVAQNICSNTTVLVNLHPRIRKEEVLPIIEKYQFIYAHQPVEELIPLSHLYIAVVSATIRTALSCGVPVINYDSYHYDYIDFNHLNGVIEVKTKKAYEKSLEDILKFEEQYEYLKKEQAQLAEKFFKMDGHAGNRILQLIEHSIQAKNSQLEQA